MKRGTRRNFLRGAAGATLLLPHLSSLMGRRAEAQTVRKRLIVVYVPQQDTEGLMPTNTSALSLVGSYFEPLEPFKNKMLWVTNMKGRSGHMEGHTECLTGYSAADWRPPQGPSVDQLVAKRLGTATPIPSLELSCGSPWEVNGDWASVAWTDKGLPLQPMTDPIRGFERLFGKMTGTPAPAPVATDLARKKKLQTSLLDSMIEDYRRTSATMSAGDRQLLDAHLTLLREQEARLQATSTTPAPTCGALTAPPDIDWKQYPARIKAHIDTLVAAVRCDATRVMTLMLGVAQEGLEHTWLGFNDNFHSVAHGDVTNFKEQHFAVRKWQNEQIAYLAQGLDSIKEGNGTALDNTIIARVSELGYYPWAQDASGRHLRDQVSTVLIGGGGGYFKTGRVIDTQQTDYCNLLLTLANAMGYEDVTSFGKFGTKAITALRG